MIERMFSRLTAHPRLLLLLWVVIVAAAVPMAAQVKPDFNVEQFFPADERLLSEHRHLVESFPYEDTTVAALLDVGSGSVDNIDIERLQKLAAAFEECGLVEVSWIGNRSRLVMNAAGELTAQPLVGTTLEATTATLSAVRDDPLFREVLFSHNQRVFTVSGVLPAARNQIDGRQALYEQLTRHIAAVGITVPLVGLPTMRAQYLLLLQSDQVLFTTTAIVLCFGLLFLFYRRFWQTVAILFAVIPAYLLCLAGLAVAGRPLTALTAIAPVLLLVVGISDSSHIISDIRRRQRAGQSPKDAVVGSFSAMALPCLGTAMSTAVGFFSIMLTNIAIVTDFAVVAGVGVLLMWLCAMVFLPPLLSMSRPQPSARAWVDAPHFDRFVLNLLALAQRRAGVLTALSVGALVVAAVGLPRLRVDTPMVDEQDSNVLVQDIRHAEELGFSSFQVNIMLDVDDAADVFRTPLRSWLESFADQAQQASPGMVTSVLSPTMMTDHVTAAMFGLPARELGPIELFEDNIATELMANPATLRPLVDVERKRARMVLFVRDAGSAATGAWLSSLQDHLLANPPPHARGSITGTVVLAQVTFDRLVAGFLRSLALSTTVIFMLLVWHFRSLRYAAIGMLPNVLPVIVLLGTLGFAGAAMTPTLVLVFSVATGLVVDDTIHLHTAIMVHRRQQLRFADAMTAAIIERGPAILQTTAVLTLAFVAMVASSFRATFLMGTLLAASMVLGLVAELLLFPAAVYWLTQRGIIR